MYSLSEGQVEIVVSYDENRCTVIFKGQTRFVTFERATYYEIERFISNSEPPDDGFYRHYLYDKDDEMIGVQKVKKDEHEEENELDLIRLELVDNSNLVSS